MPTTTSARATKATKTASKATKAKQPATKAKASNGTPKPAKATKASSKATKAPAADTMPALTPKQQAILAGVCKGAQSYRDVREYLGKPKAKGLTMAMAATSGVGNNYPRSLEARELVTKAHNGRYIVYTPTAKGHAAAKAHVKANKATS